jgi:hypothetical protein
LWPPPGTTGTGVPVGSPDLAEREQAMVAVSSKVVTAWATVVRTYCRSISPFQREKETLLIVPYAGPASSQSVSQRYNEIRTSVEGGVGWPSVTGLVSQVQREIER